jgi:hypothetical protein
VLIVPGDKYMQWDGWPWFGVSLLKAVLLVLPAFGMLWYWRRMGVLNPLLYRLSRVNVGVYALWSALALAVLVIRSGPVARWMDQAGFPAGVAFIIPFLAAAASTLLCMLCIAMKRGHRRYILLVNGLMLLFWGSVVVAPN